MSELFDDDDADSKELIAEDDIIDDVEDIEVQDSQQLPLHDARRRLEKMLEDKRLQDELEDFLDY